MSFYHSIPSVCKFIWGKIKFFKNQLPPTIINSKSVNFDNGAASITACSVNYGSADNCSSVALSVSKTYFSCAKIGNNLVALTVTDSCGNSSSCNATVSMISEITCVITEVTSSNVFTGGIPTNLYLGYRAVSDTLKVSVSPNYTPHTYSRTGTGLSNRTSANQVFTPRVGGS